MAPTPETPRRSAREFINDLVHVSIKGEKKIVLFKMTSEYGVALPNPGAEHVQFKSAAVYQAPGSEPREISFPQGTPVPERIVKYAPEVRPPLYGNELC